MTRLSDLLDLRREAEEQAADLPALRAEAEKAAANILHGEHAQRKAGSGEKFWQYREYVQGDRPQDIDWRQSAKTDHVFIRQKEWQTTQTALFWCSASPGMHYASNETLPSKAQAAKTLTLALALLMSRAGEQVGIFGGGRTGRSELALQRIGERLISGADKATLPNPYATALPLHCSFVQISDFLDPIDDIESVFKTFAARADNGLIIQILDPAEIELPFSGRVIFETPGNGPKEQVRHVDSIRAAYKQRVEEHMQALQELCRQHHWNYVLHRTDKPVSETLSLIWTMYQERPV